MKEDFVSFDLAKKLKEKGYPQKPDNISCMPYYEYDDVANYTALCNEIVWHMSSEPRDNIFAAPAIHKVLKWLREEKKIHICIGICIAPTFSWDYEIVNLDDDCYIHAECGYDSYEDAASNGISYILDNLI